MAGQMGGGSITPEIQRLGIQPYVFDTECLRGDVGAGPATGFPEAIGLGAAFSPELLFKVARATGMEVRAKNNNYTSHNSYKYHQGLSCFSPVINIMRDARWGRNEETYGEDPYLSGVYAAAFVNGLQGNDARYLLTNAGCKHFDAYAGPESVPVSRHQFNAQVSERDWRTTFLPAFRQCVKAGTYSLMCSYNSINGIPACASKELLTDILRTEWGFQGYVVSDAGAIEDAVYNHKYINNSIDATAACVNAGCNLELPVGKYTPIYNSIVDAVNQGKITKERIVEMTKPLFYTRMRLGEFDPDDMNPYKSLNVSIVQSDAHRSLALEAATKSFVLLKNDNNFLPFKSTMYSKIAIVGPMADNPNRQTGNYSPDIDEKYTVTPRQELSKLAESSTYANGCNGDNNCKDYDQTGIINAVNNTDIVFVCLGLGNDVEKEGKDRADITLPGHQLQLLQDAVQNSPSSAPVVLILLNAGPVDLRWAVGESRVVAILEIFYPSQTTGLALRNVLTMTCPVGIPCVPAGRLPFTWPLSEDQIPPMVNYSMEGRTYRYLNSEPLFPFGYGLSYTSFVYSNLQYAKSIQAGYDVNGVVTVSNTGNYDAEEVIQVYITWQNSTVPTPKIQLANFTRIFGFKQESGTFPFRITPESMAVWVDSTVGWKVEPGTYGIYVGGQQPNQKTSVGSNVLTGQFTVTGSSILGKY
ncbi:uncharacterized protein LOC126818152 [Patella vulgata]|uniref:uncharacterized protein LOC126818152 n=1 Tax=Patella vulgata TaxID=6465 RepID=UPI0024AA02B1|nr:uncharacterized protein LOC126818152 [Patella vulgata]